MREIEIWSKPISKLTNDDCFVFDTMKDRLPKGYFLNESRTRMQLAYNKNSVKVYKDYELNNEPVDGFELVCSDEKCNLFRKI